MAACTEVLTRFDLAGHVIAGDGPVSVMRFRAAAASSAEGPGLVAIESSDEEFLSVLDDCCGLVPLAGPALPPARQGAITKASSAKMMDVFVRKTTAQP
jgi:hypothetical protein